MLRHSKHLAEKFAIGSIVGNSNSKNVFTQSKSLFHMQEIIGREFGGQHIPHRLPAGHLFQLIDLASAYSAAKFGLSREQHRVKHPFMKDLGESEKSFSSATVSVPSIALPLPVLSGDLVELHAKVIDVGSSTMTIHIDANRILFPLRKKHLIADAYVVAAIIDPDNQLRPAKVVPKLRLETEEQVREQAEGRALISAMIQRQKNKEVDTSSPLAMEILNSEINSTKSRHVTPSETLFWVHQYCFPHYQNVNNVIFGGETVTWMEEAAVKCGEFFAQSHGVINCGFHDVRYLQPVFAGELVEITAKIICVRESSMIADVVLSAKRPNQGLVPLAKASFVLVLMDPMYIPQPVTTGLIPKSEEDKVDMIRGHDNMTEMREQRQILKRKIRRNKN